MDLVGPADGRRGGLAEAEETDLAGRHKFGHGADRLLDRHGLIHPVLVVQIDVVDAESLQTGVAGRADIVRAAADALETAVLAADVAEFGGEHDLFSAV